jgi:hypothetical protein
MMARSLEFRFDGLPFRCGLQKVDRGMLYGSIDVETRDAAGLKCETATLSQDRRTIVPTGGTALGYMSADGRWIERTELVAVNAAGARLNTVGSSFDAPIDLDVKTSPDRFLDHAIKSTYLLDAPDGVPGLLKTQLTEGAIFKFDFSYRGGANADPAFLLQGAEETLWLLVGESHEPTFVGFAQAAALDEAPADAGNDEDLSFDMM